MKINWKKLLKIALIIAVVIVLPDIGMYYQRFKLLFNKLPEKYKSYPEIGDIKDSDYEIAQFDSANDNPVLLVNDSTILLICDPYRRYNSDGPETLEYTTWYKINMAGSIADSIKFESNDYNHFYQTYDDYIVDVSAKTFNTWVKNGDTTTFAIKPINGDNECTEAEGMEFIKNSKYIYSQDTTSKKNADKSIYKIIFFKNNKWNYLYTDDKYWSTKPSNTHIFSENVVPYTDNDLGNPKAILNREYAYKQQWSQTSFWKFKLSFGWGNGSDLNDRWFGTGYFNILMPKKTLHFKQDVQIETNGSVKNPFEYLVHKPKQNKYLLVVRDDFRCYYIIREKQK